MSEEKRSEWLIIHPQLADVLKGREWVGLTDEEIHAYSVELYPSESTFENGAKWAEAKLRERNT